MHVAKSSAINLRQLWLLNFTGRKELFFSLLLQEGITASNQVNPPREASATHLRASGWHSFGAYTTPSSPPITVRLRFTILVREGVNLASFPLLIKREPKFFISPRCELARGKYRYLRCARQS